MKRYTEAEADEMLPQKATSAKVKPESLVYMLIGPPKFGKTTWMCNIPDALLLAFERGHAFQEAHKIAIDAWMGDPTIYDDDENCRHMTMEQVVSLLEKSDRFKFIIFDTADMAAKMCSDHFCKQNGWDHISQGGDFGKGYDIAQNTPFRQLVGRIMKTGRGIGFITHSQETESKVDKKKAKKATTLPGGIHKFLHTQADVILHGMFGPRSKEGRRVHTRVLQTAGDEETLAGNRMKEIVLPNRFIVDTKEPWKQWCSFFKDPKAAPAAEKYLESLSLKIKSESDKDEEKVD